MEKVFKFYYDTLDELRQDILGQEYYLKDQMDSFEERIGGLLRDIKSYNMIEFYHEHESMRAQVSNIRESLKSFNIYMPKYAMAVDDFDKVQANVRVDVRERINSVIKQVSSKS